MKYIRLFEDWQPNEIVFVEIPESIPQFRSYDILYQGEKAGTLDLSFLHEELEEDELEISGLILKEKFQAKGIGKKIISAMWREFPKANRIFLQSIESATGFWRKMGAVNFPGRPNYLVIKRSRFT